MSIKILGTGSYLPPKIVTNDDLAKELCAEYLAMQGDSVTKNDMTALFRIGYGLYAFLKKYLPMTGKPNNKQ